MVNSNRLTIMLNFDTYRIPVSYNIIEAVYQFTLPNIYVYSGFLVHTLDMFFLCTVEDMSHFSAMDDVADSFFLPLSEIHPEDFGLDSIRRGLSLFLAQCR